MLIMPATILLPKNEHLSRDHPAQMPISNSDICHRFLTASYLYPPTSARSHLPAKSRSIPRSSTAR